MEAAIILAELKKRGASVEVADGKVIVTPSSKLDDSLRQAIRESKPQIIAIIEGPTKQDKMACSWILCLPEGDLLTVYVPAVPLDRVQRDHPTLIGAMIAQGCDQCLWNIRPGQDPGGYCSSPDRNDKPGPYSHGHPARFLAKDGGAACEYFEGLHNGYSVNNTTL